MVDGGATIALKAGSTAAKPLAGLISSIRVSRRNAGFMQNFLRQALKNAAEASVEHNAKVALDDLDYVAQQVLKQAQAQVVAGTGLRGRARRLYGGLKRSTARVDIHTAASVAELVESWVLAALPSGDYDHAKIARQTGQEFLRAVRQVCEHAKDDELAFGRYLINMIAENDASERFIEATYEQRVLTGAAVGAGILATGATALVDSASNGQLDSPWTAGIAGLSAIAATWLTVRGRRSARPDELAAVTAAVEVARDWVEDVEAGILRADGARHLLELRLVPRLQRWDLPMLEAALLRVADHLEDADRHPTELRRDRLRQSLAQATVLISPVPATSGAELATPPIRSSPTDGDVSVITTLDS